MPAAAPAPNISEALKASWPPSVRVMAMREKEYANRLGKPPRPSV